MLGPKNKFCSIIAIMLLVSFSMLSYVSAETAEDSDTEVVTTAVESSPTSEVAEESVVVDVLDTSADIAEAAVPAIEATATSIWPVLTPVITAIAGIITAAAGAWKSMRPKLLEARDRADKYYIVTAGLVNGIESFHKENPEAWNKLKEKLSGVLGPNSENAIRALRGLPAKS